MNSLLAYSVTIVSKFAMDLDEKKNTTSLAQNGNHCQICRCLPQHICVFKYFLLTIYTHMSYTWRCALTDRSSLRRGIHSRARFIPSQRKSFTQTHTHTQISKGTTSTYPQIPNLRLTFSHPIARWRQKSPAVPCGGWMNGSLVSIIIRP